MVVATILHYLERLVEFWTKTGGFAAANEKLLAAVIWPNSWSVLILVVVLIFMYWAIHLPAREGYQKKKMKRIFFGPL